jgi:hypothetical protein
MIGARPVSTLSSEVAAMLSSTSGPRVGRLIALVAVSTAAPPVALLWLGFRVREQDQQLERQQIQDRLERAADAVIADVQRRVAATEEQLLAGANDWPIRDPIALQCSAEGHQRCRIN